MDRVTSRQIYIITEATEAARGNKPFSFCDYIGEDREIWEEAFKAVLAARLIKLFGGKNIRVRV